jgi:hypothetical protein
MGSPSGLAMSRNVRVQLRDIATGATVVYVDTWCLTLDGLEYIWTEGNYACDCNRELFFRRALGETPGSDLREFHCGDGVRYALDWLEVDGERVPL